MVAQPTIEQAPERLREAAPGSAILLFGSHARGEPGPDSDVGFLVIEPDVASPLEKMVRLRRVLSRVGIPVDVLVASDPGDVVLDPFSGSGTTCVVAGRLARQYVGIDLSERYVAESRRRLDDTLAGRRAGTEIAEDPEAIRHLRSVGRGRRRVPRAGRGLFGG